MRSNGAPRTDSDSSPATVRRQSFLLFHCPMKRIGRTEVRTMRKAQSPCCPPLQMNREGRTMPKPLTKPQPTSSVANMLEQSVGAQVIARPAPALAQNLPLPVQTHPSRE